MRIPLKSKILRMLLLVVVSVARSDEAPPDRPAPILCANTKECGEPLFLTQFLNKSNVLEAQRAAMVQFPDVPEFKQVRHIQSYSGFFTVNETINSNIFFWFFPAETNPKDSPVLLWLDGGPGLSTTEDIFGSVGPLQIGDDMKLTPSLNRWTKTMNVLYFDNPVGAGFSFTKNSSGYARDENDYTRDLYAALSQFFQLFPDHLTNDFFIGGISYAGKYVPSLAYEIHKKNPTSPVKINLKGIAIGDGWVDPLIQLRYSEFLYGISLIDSETRVKFEKVEQEITALILNEEYAAASSKLNHFLFGQYSRKNDSKIMMNNETILTVTGLSIDNYLISAADYISKGKVREEKLVKIIVNPVLRKNIHVGSQEFLLENDKYVTNYLLADKVRSVVPKLQVLMDYYRVVLYAGQLDIICNYRLMIDFVKNLKWEGAEEYGNATRHQWRVGGELAGYAKTAGNFTEILMRNAGHATFDYKPSWTLDLLERVCWNKPFF